MTETIAEKNFKDGRVLVEYEKEWDKEPEVSIRFISMHGGANFCPFGLRKCTREKLLTVLESISPDDTFKGLFERFTGA